MRVAISGTHCAGKTTLLNAIKLIFPDLQVIEEIARRFDPMSRSSVLVQHEIMMAQVKAESRYHQFLSDRTVFDNWAYCNLAYLHRCVDHGDYYTANRLDRLIMRGCQHIMMTHARSNPYDLIIFVDEMLPMVDDGNRNTNLDDQERIHNFLRSVLHDPAYCTCPVLDVRGTTEDRVDQVDDHLTKLFAERYGTAYFSDDNESGCCKRRVCASR